MKLFQFTPALTPDPLKAARELCEKWQGKINGNACVKPLRRITLVGAEYKKEKFERSNDVYFLRGAIAQCGAHNIPVDPDFIATPLNIAYCKDQDFLNPELKVPSDLVLTCFLFRPYSSLMGCFNESNDPDFFVSPKWHIEGAWHDAAKKYGAKVVVTIGWGSAISTDDFIPKAGAQSHFVACKTMKVEPCVSEVNILLSKPFAKKLLKEEPALR